MLVKRTRKVEGLFRGGIGFLICLFTWGPDFGSLREPGPSFVAFFTGFFIAGIGMVMAFLAFISKTFQSDASGLSSYLETFYGFDSLIPWVSCWVTPFCSIGSAIS